jgi:phage repressor protein C with HTH and peptisase S24 domain
METKVTNIKERVLEIASKKGISKERFFEQIGSTYGNFKGKAKDKALSSETLATIVTMYSDVNTEWLLTGQGEMLKTEKEHKPAKPAQGGIPLVAVEAIGGIGSADFKIAESDIVQTYIVPDFSDIHFMLRVKGNSMAPAYMSGDIVACRIIRNPSFIQWGKAHLIATREQGIIIKRLNPGQTDNTYICVSDNPDFSPFLIHHDDITGIALIVGFVRLD